MSLQENVHSTQECLNFLKFIYPTGPWTLTTIIESTLKAETFSDREIGEMQRWLEAQNGQANIYWQINKLRCHPVKNKATLQHVLELNRLHVDLDPRKGQFNKEDERKLILGLLDNEPRLKEIGLPGGPSLIIDSGNGFWGFWNLAQAEPVIGDSEEELRKNAAEFGRFNRWIVEVLNKALNSTSADGHREIADACHNLDRIARLPGTYNMPDAKKRAAGYVPVPSKIYASYPQRLYTLDQFQKSDVISWGARTTSAELNSIQVGNIVRTLPGSINPWEIAEELKRQYPQIGQRTLELICAGEYTEQEFGEDDINDKQSSTGELVTNRSRAHWRVNRSLQQFGVPLNVILGILCDERLPISAHGREPEDKRQARRSGRELIRFTETQIRKCAASIANQRKQETLEAQVLTGSPAPTNDNVIKKENAPNKNKPGNASELVKELNQKHCVLLQEGGKTKVLSWEKSELDYSREVPVLQSFADFHNRYMNQIVNVGSVKEPKYKPWGKVWLEHPHRRQYLALRFMPNQPAVVDGYLNMWRGFAVEAKMGSCQLMLEHIKTVLANNDEKCNEYIIKWTAWTFQHPDEPAEVALVFKGGKGTGKGIFARTIKRIFGQHGLQITSPMQLTGRFNSHLRDCCLLFADEAIVPEDKKAENVLKSLITEPEIPIEGKGVNVVQARNHLHIIMASNDDWVVPAGIDERRFAVFEVSQRHQQESAYFTALAKELTNGGMEALLHYFLNYDLRGWHPRESIPQTEALRKQKEKGLHPFEQFMLNMLEEGVLAGGLMDHNTVYSNDHKDELGLYNCIRQSSPKLRDASYQALSGYLKKWGAANARSTKGKQLHGWTFPTLGEMRKHWDKTHWKHEWPDTNEVWNGSDFYEDEEIPF